MTLYKEGRPQIIKLEKFTYKRKLREGMEA